MKPEKEFTTFEAAKICGVWHTTVINWVNKGKLKARLTPGGHRRIAQPDLVEFMRRFEMPVPADLSERARSVLIVEDDAAVSRMLQRALEPFQDVRVRACSSGIEALIGIGREAPDLLILDINIPQINGMEICRILRPSEQTRPIKILAVSGEVLSEKDAHFLKLHADAFLQKPLSTARLRQEVERLLGLERFDNE